MKTCRKCGHCGPLKDFVKCNHTADGHSSPCRKCHYKRIAQARKDGSRKHIDDKYHKKYRAREDVLRRRAMNETRRRNERSPEKVAAEKERKKKNIPLRLRQVISSRINHGLKGKKEGVSTMKMLHYSLTDLKAHLERQFTKGMSWDNFGQWHVDNILPYSSFKITGPHCPELRAAWALTNLRPLWARENKQKSYKRLHLL